MSTLAHISDLHFGAENPVLVEALVADLRALGPSLVVVSGDLTQRARRREFAKARAFLDRLPFPRLVVPGNHDIPLFDLVSRFVSPLARFRRYVAEDVDPFFASETLAVLGLNTARSNRWKEGRISPEQIDLVRRRFGPLPPHVVKVLVTHHPFLPPPGAEPPPLVGRAAEALYAAEACGVDLVLSGHLHLGYTGDVRAHHAHVGRALLVAQAGTATSHRLRDEVNSYNVLELSPQRLAFTRRAWNESAFHEARRVDYVKSGSEWTPAIP